MNRPGELTSSDELVNVGDNGRERDYEPKNFLLESIGSRSVDSGRLHMHDSWASTAHDAPQMMHTSTMVPLPTAGVSDEVRHTIIREICNRPGIWDCQREKTSGLSRKELFAEVTAEVNRRHRMDPPPHQEEVEKAWKNLKDTYIKCRKKLHYNTDGQAVFPKWKFYSHLTFLEGLYRSGMKRRMTVYDEEEMPMSQPSMAAPMKTRREDPFDEIEDESISFCRSLVYPLREISQMDRVKCLQIQNKIRDIVHNTHLELVSRHSQLQPPPPPPSHR